jgi:glycosyltransferase involved in cell wall biosynthesis
MTAPVDGPRARVIVATYEQPQHLRRALRGYLRQTSRDFVLVVADDGSGDETRQIVEAFADEAAAAGVACEHVRHEDRGYRRAAILNEAARRADGERLLVFTDGDCVPPAHFVARHLEAHEHRSFHVGGVILLTEAATAGLTEADVDAGRYEALATEADLRSLRRRARKSRWGMLLRRKNRPKVFGANLAVDRALFEAVNGFDEAFPDYGFEDSDLRDRLMRTRPRPRVKVLHGRNDVFHLHHPRPAGRREASRAYYETTRPVRCVRGLVPPPSESS